MLANTDDRLRLSPSASSGTGEALLDRKRLLVSLLSDREAVRVICAPPLYGKTVLATQYARLAFPPSDVTWVQASEPEFLLNLDSGTFERTVDESAPKGEKLVVFDGISKLKGKRRTNLVSLVGKLHTKNCEVMVTTEDSSLASDVELPVVLLDAREMALAHDELPTRSDPVARFPLPDDKPERKPKRTMPPVVLDKEAGPKRFLQSLLANAPASAEESLAYLALFAGSGDLVSLLVFFTEEEKPDLLLVERRFPYAGIRRTASTFNAFDLSNAGRHELMCAHCATIAPFTRFRTEDPFNMACAELCLSLGNRPLLMMGLDYLSLRKAFIAKHGEEALGIAAECEDACKTQAMVGLPSGMAPVPKRSAASPVRIDLFGRCEITRDGVGVLQKGELRRKAKVVLALLLVSNGIELPRTWIERIVWPDSDPACVRSSFYNLWSYIRRVLTPPDEEPFGSRRSRDTVSFSGLNFESDVVEVGNLCLRLNGCDDPRQCANAMQEIERLYCGPLLPGVQNDQIEAYRITYQNRVLDALVDGVRVLMHSNDLRSAQHYAEFAFSIDQTREDVVYQYMKVQQRLGQFGGAISTYVSCRRALVDRFGIDGSNRLEELYDEILKEVSSADAGSSPRGGADSLER